MKMGIQFLFSLGLIGAVLMIAACGSNPVHEETPELRKAILTWPPVVTATDGSEVNDITGYRLEIITPEGVTPINLPADATTHTLIAPTTGGYSFRLIAISASRGESDASNTVSKTFIK